MMTRVMMMMMKTIIMTMMMMGSGFSLGPKHAGIVEASPISRVGHGPAAMEAARTPPASDCRRAIRRGHLESGRGQGQELVEAEEGHEEDRGHSHAWWLSVAGLLMIAG